MLFNYTSYRNKISALLVMLLLCSPFCINAQIITTLAGNGRMGFAGDGDYASYATFNNPQGMLMDKLGNLYISDQNNNKIRKISSYGIITTFAGVGTSAGSTGDGGPANKAKLSSPAGMTMDKYGNIFFADSKNNKIRKIDTAGIITTVVGNGVAKFSGDNGPAILASLNNPKDVVVDGVGTLYIADFQNHRIRMVDTNGIITTIAGTGDATYYGNGVPASAAKLNKPSAVALAKDGSLLIADTYNNLIRRIGADSLITTVAGNGTPGFGGDNTLAGVSQINKPVSLVVDRDGNAYFADQNNNRVRKIDLDGKVSTVAGTGNPGGGGNGGLAIEAQLYQPSCVTVDTAGNLYIGELQNRIRYVYLDTNAQETKMEVFPVPCNKNTNIFLPSKYEETAYVYVLNAEGREVSKFTAITNRYIRVHFDFAGAYVIYAVAQHNSWRGKAIAIQ